MCPGHRGCICYAPNKAKQTLNTALVNSQRYTVIIIYYYFQVSATNSKGESARLFINAGGTKLLLFKKKRFKNINRPCLNIKTTVLMSDTCTGICRRFET